MSTEIEIWRDVVGVAGYQVSSCGRVRSVDRQLTYSTGHTYMRRGKILASARSSNGYQNLSLGAGIRRTVHSLVAEAFLGPYPKGMEVNHKSGDKGDNRPENLEYVTRLGNIRHARENGLCNDYGENNGSAKYTEKQVRDVHALIAGGKPVRSAAAEIGMGYGAAYDIAAGICWKHLNLEPLKGLRRRRNL